MKKLLLSSLGCLAIVALSAQANNYPNGATVADFTVTDTDGNSHTLSDYTSQGKHVMLDFFFDTCPPCQSTSLYFSEAHELYGCNDGDVVFLAINNGTDNDAEVIAYENTYGGSSAHPPAASSDGGSAAVDAAFGVSAYPTYCLIGPSSTMLANDIWPISSAADLIAPLANTSAQQQACATSVTELASASFSSVSPNPSNGQVNVSIALVEAANVVVEVFDILGQQVRTVPMGTLAQGSTAGALDLTDLNQGHYMLKLNANNEISDVQRITITR